MVANDEANFVQNEIKLVENTLSMVGSRTARSHVMQPYSVQRVLAEDAMNLMYMT